MKNYNVMELNTDTYLSDNFKELSTVVDGSIEEFVNAKANLDREFLENFLTILKEFYPEELIGNAEIKKDNFSYYLECSYSNGDFTIKIQHGYRIINNFATNWVDKKEKTMFCFNLKRNNGKEITKNFWGMYDLERIIDKYC